MAINGCPLLLMGEPQGITLIMCMYGCIAIVELNGITNYNSYINITTLLSSSVQKSPHSCANDPHSDVYECMLPVTTKWYYNIVVIR